MARADPQPMRCVTGSRPFRSMFPFGRAPNKTLSRESKWMGLVLNPNATQTALKTILESRGGRQRVHMARAQPHPTRGDASNREMGSGGKMDISVPHRYAKQMHVVHDFDYPEPDERAAFPPQNILAS